MCAIIKRGTGILQFWYSFAVEKIEVLSLGLTEQVAEQ